MKIAFVLPWALASQVESNTSLTINTDIKRHPLSVPWIHIRERILDATKFSVSDPTLCFVWMGVQEDTELHRLQPQVQRQNVRNVFLQANYIQEQFWLFSLSGMYKYT